METLEKMPWQKTKGKSATATDFTDSSLAGPIITCFIYTRFKQAKQTNNNKTRSFNLHKNKLKMVCHVGIISSLTYSAAI